MFFIFSKILFLFLMPLSLIFCCFAYGLWTKNARHKARSLKSGLFLILLFSNGSLVNEALLAWEVPPVAPHEITGTFEFGVILGGGLIQNKTADADQIFASETSDRFIQPLRLYKQGKIRKLLISGGSVSINGYSTDVSDESRKVAQLLIELGVRKEDIVLELHSRNTRENALNSQKILKTYQNSGKILLFTSAFHMRRAVGCFQKAGIEVQPFSTDFRSEIRNFNPGTLLIPHEKSLFLSYFLIRELIGYTVYKIIGYI